MRKIGILVSLMVVLVSCAVCENQVLDRTESATGETAILFVRSCGATTANSYHVSVLAAGRRLRNRSGNVFVGDSSTNPEIEWIESERLRITYYGDRVFLKKESIGRVVIEYVELLR